jgi:hypothetical protein
MNYDDVIVGYSQHLDEFTLNVNMKTMDKYNITFEDSLKYLIKLPSSNIVIFKENYIYNTLYYKHSDIIFAIESKFEEAVLCKIFIGGDFIHEVTLLPDKIEWILNGCPIILIRSCQLNEVTIELYNVATNDKIDIENNIYIYKMNLQSNFRKALCNSSSCDISDEYNIKYESGKLYIEHDKTLECHYHFNRRPPLEN